MRALRLIGLVLCVLAASAAGAQERVALVVGNGAYQHAPRLANAANDARAMAQRLRGIGFAVDLVEDATLPVLSRALREFGARAQGASVALLFFAGHGLQVARGAVAENYLVPVDARLTDVRDVDEETVPLTRALARMDGARTRLVFLDACRDNPLAAQMRGQGATRSMGRGLARIDAAERGTLIAFATDPNNVALDGSGANSPFTAALAEHIGTPGLDIRQVLSRVRGAVLAATGGRQTPYTTDVLVEDVILVPAAALPQVQPQPQPQPGDQRLAAEVAFWQSIQASRDPADFQAYLAQFPNGTFATIAQNRLQALRGAEQDREADTRRRESEAAERERRQREADAQRARERADEERRERERAEEERRRGPPQVAAVPALRAVYLFNGAANGTRDRFWRRFAERAAAGSAGAVQLERHRDVIADIAAQSAALLAGMVDMVDMPLSAIPGLQGFGDLFDLPFLVRDRDHLGRALAGPTGARIRAASQGFEILGFVVHGVRGIAASRNPPATPQALRGQRLRLSGSEVGQAAWRALGVTPVVMAPQDVPPALDRNTIAGVEASREGYGWDQLNRTARTYVDTRHSWSVGAVIVSRHYWQGRDARQRAAIQAAADAAIRDYDAMREQAEEQALAGARNAGARIVTVDQAQWRAAFQPAWRAQAAAVGGMDAIMEVVNTP